ncbi:DMT family transporter [Aquimarina longa]|uniref:DMT family transporter n=1 Tax=Aquimarina longa TaxID=1080221 RepID=UPI000784BA2E|nr:DMT family transporter [Aquimarina longa]
MKLIILYSLAFIGGIFLAIQAGFNTQLGALLKQPILAVIATSISSTVFGVLFVLVIKKETIQMELVEQIPWYLWCVGGFFSVLGISLYFYTIPKLGISKMIAIGLCGQLFFSLIAGKFGWLNLPVEPFTIKRALGALAMIVGILLINTK